MDVSPQAIFSIAACYRSYSNATTGDLLELGLLAVIAMNISPEPPPSGNFRVTDTGAERVTDAGENRVWM